jgi:lysophospholipase L1-like esterase
MTTSPRSVAPVLLFSLAACGGGSSSGPTPLPSPSTVPGATVVAVVFYDENGNGRADADEQIRVPDVEVTVGGRSAKSAAATGQAVVTGVPAGAQMITVKADTLPPFYSAQAAVPIQVPTPDGTQTMIGLTLPIDSNLTNVYLAFGDSITRGDGSSSGGYPPRLQARLAAYFGGAAVVNKGADATNSAEGVERVKRQVSGQRPAYTLIMYGTNDWNAPQCQDNPRCETVGNLRTIIQTVKVFRSLPVIATIAPTDPTQNPPSRNQWISDVNNLLRTMAASEGAVVADVFQAFMKQPDLSKLFSDHIHPNDAGYAVISDAFFEAIAHGRATPASAAGPVLFAAPRP